MFDKEYSFRGSHAEKVNKLTSVFDGEGGLKLFNRNIDVYIIAPIVGFLYNRKALIDKSSDKNTKIFGDILIKEQTSLKYNYRLIILLDKEHEQSFQERLNKAFRYYDSEKTAPDEERFEQYVRGGVDVLFEKLIEGANSSEDYIKKLYDFMEEFHERYNETVSSESIFDLCKLARS